MALAPGRGFPARTPQRIPPTGAFGNEKCGVKPLGFGVFSFHPANCLLLLWAEQAPAAEHRPGRPWGTGLAASRIPAPRPAPRLG